MEKRSSTMSQDDFKNPKRSLGAFSSQRAKKRPRILDEPDLTATLAAAQPPPPPPPPRELGSRTLRAKASRGSFRFPGLHAEPLQPLDQAMTTPAAPLRSAPSQRRRSELKSGLDDITKGIRRLFRRPKDPEEISKRVRRTESFATRKAGWFRHGDERPLETTHPGRGRPMSSLGFAQHVRAESGGSNPALLHVPATIRGGEAARAAAASQNRRSTDLRPVRSTSDRFKRREAEMVDSEAESGIGIDLKEPDVHVSAADSAECLVVRRDPTSVLPVEITASILSLLDHRSLVQAETVSRAWRRAATSHHVWRDMFQREFRGSWVLPSSSPNSIEESGRGMGKRGPDQDWKKIVKVKKELSRRWEKGDIKYSKIEGHADSVYCVQFDEDKIITGSRDKTVRVWDMRTYRCLKVLANPLRPIPHPRGFRPDETVSRSTSNIFHDASILCLQFDNGILVTGSSDHSAIVWSIKHDYRPIWRLQGHNLGVLDVSFDDKHIVTCSKDYTACVWDRKTGELLRQLKGHSGPVNAVQMRGDLVVSVSGDTLIKLWNIPSGKCIKELAGHTRGLACTQLSEDSRLIVSGGNDCVIRLWDTASGTTTRELHGHENLIRSLHFDSDSGRVISGSYDQSIKVYDVKTGRLLIDFPKWTSSWILSTKADYRRIVCTSQDGKISVMDFGVGLDGIEMLEA